MDHAKLYGVLVIGGAMLGLGCGGTGPTTMEPDAYRAPDATTPLPDAASGTDAASGGTDAASGGADAGPLQNCGFCPNTACCEGGHERAGMMCCWGTSC